eukprot:CAMPEP_0173394546 /NCGR_PEP_ID=MMETSP1356-20130122/28073_1 /TAXON_ID=77927 ORGANISM="Hemiselmis virescens, Strain PCC157" /NCGR_SAMPLE_ID=MMETSP1356 /ASSEMBLY_ACC=CAM_ASM_000847 /LENGTH=144 /DNA_ID=CAMNT_0014352957 /DNA_START=58 /DNA_END=489 /DNA_ORIENTATION=-
MGACASISAEDDPMATVRPAKLRMLRDEFDMFDGDGREVLNEKQFEALLNKRVYRARECRKVDVHGDLSHTGLVAGSFKYSEKLYSMDHKLAKINAAAAFKEVDKQGSGWIGFTQFVAWQRKATPEDPEMGVTSLPSRVVRNSK